LKNGKAAQKTNTRAAATQQSSTTMVCSKPARTAFSADSLFSKVPSPFGAWNPLLDHWPILFNLG
jgi:hypothetical protein